MSYSKLDIDAKKLDVEIKKLDSEARAAQSRHSLFRAITTLIILAASGFISFVVISSIASMLLCSGTCEVSMNDELNSQGFVSDIDTTKSTVFMISYTGMHTESSSNAFRKSLTKVRSSAKEGDILLLSINSNGGDAIACANDYYLVNELELLNKVKTVAVVDRAAHSCGYYLASSADEIYASQGASVGNIGSAIQMYTNVIDGALKKLTGEGLKTFGSTRVKEIFAGDAIHSEEDENIVRKYVEDNAQYFFMDVVDARGDRLKESDREEAFSAYPFSARKALELGLIDGINSKKEMLLTMHKDGHTITGIYVAEQKDSSFFSAITGIKFVGSIFM